jgi:hypothetical protein
MPDETLDVVTYPREAVLNIHQVAAALQVDESSVDRYDLPCVYLSSKKRRWVWGVVLDHLARKSA